MPNLKIGERANFEQGGIFTSLKKKGDSILLRLLGNLYYNGVHLIPIGENKWQSSDCPKINTEEYCEICNTYAKAIKPVWELKKQLKTITNKKEKAIIKGQIEDILDAAKDNKVKVNFYYPILDRATGRAKIFKTSTSVRIKFDTELKAGIDVFAYDWTIVRVQESPQNYYSVVRVDSSQMKPLTDSEKAEIEKAKLWNVGEMVEGKQSDSFPDKPVEEKKTDEEVKPPKEGENTEKVNPEDIPF